MQPNRTQQLFSQRLRASLDNLQQRWPGLFLRLDRYIRLTRLDKPIGIFLLLWPTLWGLWIAAEGLPNPNILIIFCLGVIMMRSAGCAINDFADRRIDGRVARTRGRPLATGELSPVTAVASSPLTLPTAVCWKKLNWTQRRLVSAVC